MGLFDKFKKKKESNQQEKQVQQSIQLNYGANGTADLKFMGLIDVQGKILSNVTVTYIDENGAFRQGSFLLEPNMIKDENGNWIDGTEQYYSGLTLRHQEAMNRFFAKEAIMNDAQGSNYIGGLEVLENGTWSRKFDANFRDKYREYTRIQKTKMEQDNIAKHNYEKKQIKDYMREQQQIGIQNQLRAQVYEEDTTGYANRLTQEDYQKYFGHRENKVVDNNNVR